ncbi:DUF2927 domain-containing protein [Micromonospora phytophila]|uniref:DUF2927 domain-containing protein n=1 Tax=Micromonospora phytophila TaxID=709888 RepID=UPI00203078D7|nr:DUF2927 domain-containing protein [Micromonospora phytophila]MCM0678684.1 DUF2927 domain-containing protein [Micromonospora phytophila]
MTRTPSQIHGGTPWVVVVIAGVLMAGGCSTAKAPSQPSLSVATAASAAASPSVEPSPTPARPRVSKKALNYFFKIALGAEYGGDRIVVKWTKPVVTVRTDGTVSSASQKCLRKVISDFNALTATTDLKLTRDSAADVTIHFAPVARFPSLSPKYVPGNDGFFYAWFNGEHRISSATVLVRTTGISDTLRCDHIRKALTRSTGLMRESNQYPDSIFYGRHSTTTRYSKLDEQIISLLYSDAIGAGYDQVQVTSAVQVLP